MLLLATTAADRITELILDSADKSVSDPMSSDMVPPSPSDPLDKAFQENHMPATPGENPLKEVFEPSESHERDTNPPAGESY